MVAAGAGKTDCVSELLRRGADVHSCDYVRSIFHLIFAPLSVNYIDFNLFQEGCTALFYASRNGHVDCMRTLLQSGSRVNHANRVIIDRILF